MFLEMIYLKKCKKKTITTTTGEFLINTNIGQNLQKDGGRIGTILSIMTILPSSFCKFALYLLNTEHKESVSIFNKLIYISSSNILDIFFIFSIKKNSISKLDSQLKIFSIVLKFYSEDVHKEDEISK
jgi:hypothetical protein